MSDLFEGLHAKFFEGLFSLDEPSRQMKAAYLREIGVPEAVIAMLCAPGIQAGQMFDGCLAGDVGRFVERILFRQGASAVLLLCKRPPYDECGHIDVSILEVVPAVDAPTEQEEGRGGGGRRQGCRRGAGNWGLWSPPP